MSTSRHWHERSEIPARGPGAAASGNGAEIETLSSRRISPRFSELLTAYEICEIPPAEDWLGQLRETD
jgi:hypothetical protein